MRGRPRATGPFNTHEELRDAIRIRRFDKGYFITQLSAVFKLNWRTIKRIVDELEKEE